jgi:hypothetical protein
LSARVFRTEIGGGVRAGIEFDSVEELEAFLAARGVVLVEGPSAASLPASPSCELEGAVRPGRPSFDTLIASVIDELGEELDRCGSLAAQARLVLERIEAQRRPEDPPAPRPRTVEIFIAAYRRPGTRKLPRKSVRA